MYDPIPKNRPNFSSVVRDKHDHLTSKKFSMNRFLQKIIEQINYSYDQTQFRNATGHYQWFALFQLRPLEPNKKKLPNAPPYRGVHEI